MSEGLAERLARTAQAVEEGLQALLASLEAAPERLRAALAHAVLGGGKRLRPALVLTAARFSGGGEEAALPGALALELIHGYSLVHDDLPCMDDDDLRRGRPTVHRVFGEGLAVLAGDALQALAFQVLAEGPAPPERRLAALAELARAAGPEGMVGGQVLDLEAEGRPATPASVARIHALKTAALLRAACLVGARLGGGDARQIEALGRYGRLLGLAFQIRDDCLDETADAAALGKAAGKDRDRGKATWPRAAGLEAAVRRARELAAEARAALAGVPGVESERAILQDLASFAVDRKR